MHTQHSHCSIDIVSTLCHHCITTDHCRCMLLLSYVTMMDQSGAAAGVSYCSRALPLHWLVSTILAPLCRGKAAVSFPAAPACSTTVCVSTHCRVCPVCAHTAALQHDPALQPCPGCCEETAHALTMHCIALLLVCAAGRHGTLLPLQWCYLLWIGSIDPLLSKKLSTGTWCSPGQIDQYWRKVAMYPGPLCPLPLSWCPLCSANCRPTAWPCQMVTVLWPESPHLRCGSHHGHGRAPQNNCQLY